MTIHDAAWRGNIRSVKRLLNAGINVNQRNIEGYTPLMMASARGHTYIIRHLLNKGADARAKSRPGNGQTALILAAGQPRTDAIRALISQSNLNSRDRYGRSVLAVAAAAGHPNVIRTLIRAGARPNDSMRVYTNSNNITRNLIGNALLKRALLKRTIHRIANRRRTHAMRGQLSSARVQTGSTYANGIPPNLLNKITKFMKRGR